MASSEGLDYFILRCLCFVNKYGNFLHLRTSFCWFGYLLQGHVRKRWFFLISVRFLFAMAEEERHMKVG